MWIRHPHWQLPLIIRPSTCRYLLVSDTGLVCNIGYTSETHPKVKSRKVSFIYSIRFNNPIVVISLPCPVQHFKTILQLIHVLSSDKISRDGSLKCVAISHSNPSLVPQLILDIIHESVWDASTHTSAVMEKLLCTDQYFLCLRLLIPVSHNTSHEIWKAF